VKPKVGCLGEGAFGGVGEGNGTNVVKTCVDFFIICVFLVTGIMGKERKQKKGFRVPTGYYGETIK
jgi:hypothetical protein